MEKGIWKRSPAGWEAARVLYWKGVPPSVMAHVGDGRNVGALGFGASCGSEAAISLCLGQRARGEGGVGSGGVAGLTVYVGDCEQRRENKQ